jgi:serine acetyltransferase
MIAAGAVVAQDIEPNCLVGGVPAKVIRRLVPIEKRMNKEIGSEDLGELESVLGDCYGQ